MGLRNYSVDEYLVLEEGANLRHEYYVGDIFALSGSTLEHNQITLNLATVFRDRDCQPYVIEVRVRTLSGLYAYPDVMVICGTPAFTNQRPQSVTNPILIAEVLSDSTRDYDRGEKFELYRSIPTLRDYLLIDQYTIDVEHRFLAGAQWNTQRYTKREDAVRLTGVDVTVDVGALYEYVDFTASR